MSDFLIPSFEEERTITINKTAKQMRDEISMNTTFKYLDGVVLCNGLDTTKQHVFAYNITNDIIHLTIFIKDTDSLNVTYLASAEMPKLAHRFCTVNNILDINDTICSKEEALIFMEDFLTTIMYLANTPIGDNIQIKPKKRGRKKRVHSDNTIQEVACSLYKPSSTAEWWVEPHIRTYKNGKTCEVKGYYKSFKINDTP